jgi:hypothetical protein
MFDDTIAFTRSFSPPTSVSLGNSNLKMLPLQSFYHWSFWIKALFCNNNLSNCFVILFLQTAWISYFDKNYGQNFPKKYLSDLKVAIYSPSSDFRYLYTLVIWKTRKRIYIYMYIDRYYEILKQVLRFQQLFST